MRFVDNSCRVLTFSFSYVYNIACVHKVQVPLCEFILTVSASNNLHALHHTASRNINDWWLAYWISNSHTHPGTLLNTTTTITMYHHTLSTNQSQAVLREASDNLAFYLGIYGGLATANSVSDACGNHFYHYVFRLDWNIIRH